MNHLINVVTKPEYLWKELNSISSENAIPQFKRFLNRLKIALGRRVTAAIFSLEGQLNQNTKKLWEPFIFF